MNRQKMPASNAGIFIDDRTLRATNLLV